MEDSGIHSSSTPTGMRYLSFLSVLSETFFQLPFTIEAKKGGGASGRYNYFIASSHPVNPPIEHLDPTTGNCYFSQRASLKEGILCRVLYM